ncbi:MAG: glutamine synthetase family protein [Eubacterium sp.]|nr:glutamine synthetase family protein [Eubacterium sp.]
MIYSPEEITQFIEEEDVKFIRLMFRDAYGVQKNISVMPKEIKKAFTEGIAINARHIDGFSESTGSLLYLRPDASTLTILPWRPESGRVVKMFCDVYTEDGKLCDADTRVMLERAVKHAEEKGIEFKFGSKSEFYLFKLDDEGNRTEIPYDEAGYMDIAPADKGENIRREICLTIEEMGLQPERSHHEEGPGQNEIDFHHGLPLEAADQMSTFMMAVSTIAGRNGLCADFSPVPLKGNPGNGYHINIYATDGDGKDVCKYVAAGILDKIKDITLFMNPSDASYRRFGTNTAPDRINWSAACPNALMHVSEHKGLIRTELRSPDALSNPYLAYSLLIEAGLYGIENRLELPEGQTGDDLLLPQSLKEAREIAMKSDFIKKNVPQAVLDSYCAD